MFSFTFIHSIGMCRMWRFLAVFRSFFHSSLLCTFSCHPSPPTLLHSSLTLSCHLFLGLPLNPVVPIFIYNTLLGILFSFILCTCPNQRNIFNLIFSIIVGFLTLEQISSHFQSRRQEQVWDGVLQNGCFFTHKSGQVIQDADYYNMNMQK